MADRTGSLAISRSGRSPRLATGGRNLPRDSGIAGAVRDAETGHPLLGLQVSAHLLTGTEREETERRTSLVETALGSGLTDYRGSFFIELDEEIAAAADAALDALTPPSRLVLRVARNDRSPPYLQSDPVTFDATDPVILLIPLPGRAVDSEVWTELADLVEAARIDRVSDLLRELVLLPTEISAFAGWPMEKRLDVARALETAFLDPQGLIARHGPVPTFHAVRYSEGDRDLLEALAALPEIDPAVDAAAADAFARLTSFRSLAEVDWRISPDAFRRAEPGEALNRQKPPTASKIALDISMGIVDDLVASTPVDHDLIGYRDYLRGILTGAPGSGRYRDSIGPLGNRLHQAFTTLDTGERPTNQLLIPILKEILTAAKGAGYGFGVAASAIEAQADRSDREYLDHLIGLSGTSGSTLEKRYRVRFDRPASARSSQVGLNIEALQGFLQDGFQSAADPHNAIIPPDLLGTAPFFLRYDEWRSLRAPFHAENHLPLKDSFTSRIRPDEVERAVGKCDEDEWFVHLLEAETALRVAHGELRNGQTETARAGYLAVRGFASLAIAKAPASRAAEDAGMKNASLESVVGPLIDKIHAINTSTPEGLEELLNGYGLPYYFNWPMVGETDANKLFRQWLKNTYPQHLLNLIRLSVLIVPACLGDLAVAAGEHETAIDEFAEATRFLVATAGISDPPGWVRPQTGADKPIPSLATPLNALESYKQLHARRGGGLPYTADIDPVEDPVYFQGYEPWRDIASRFAALIVDPAEKRLLVLHHANAILDWADTLYRSDEPASVERARELYKAALFLHGIKPGINPSWPASPGRFVGEWAEATPGRATPKPATRNTLQTGSYVLAATGGAPVAAPAEKLSITTGSRLPHFADLLTVAVNPARAAQIQHATRCLLQIRHGLNIYGSSDMLVPVLRYDVLKTAADRFTADAKGTQSDLIQYVSKVEDALQAKIINAHLLQKAQLHAQIAEEQKALAGYQVELAERQVAAIEGEIKAKRKQLKEEKEFLNQFTTFVGGMVTSIGDLAKGMMKSENAGSTAAAGVGASEVAGSLGAGAAAASGYGAFVYAGFSSMQAMGEAWDSIVDQIRYLEDEVLPLAKETVAARNREQTIAHLQQQVAQSDASLARELIDFASTRFLDLDFWNQMVELSRRLLRRYLELATQHAWLAERALAYEQDRHIDVVRLDYFPPKMQGIGGADQLRADLAELEAAKITGARATIPITRVFSLAFEFPLQFAELRETGRCTFSTSELPLVLAHPGTYGHRVRAVTVRAVTVGGVRAPHGLLSNNGVSTVRRADGKSHLSLRAADALPISGFRLRRDADVFGFPGETLMAFEGGAMNALWTLELPAAANPGGLVDLLDVELVFDVRALYSPVLHAADRQSAPTALQRSMIVSAAYHAPEALEELREGSAGPVTVEFDLASLLPPTETERTLSNLVVMLAGMNDGAVQATLECDEPALSVPFEVEHGVAFSNAPPLAAAGDAESPLNVLVGVDPGQRLRLVFAGSPAGGGELSEIRDVVLAAEYGATLSG